MLIHGVDKIVAVSLIKDINEMTDVKTTKNGEKNLNS